MQPAHIALLVGSLMLAACAAPPSQQSAVRFTKPDATQEQYMADRYACYQQSALPRAGAYVNPYAGANSGLVHSRSRWLACMGKRGYVLDSNGVLFPPPRTEIFFQEP
jgi:hypothetical protein